MLADCCLKKGTKVHFARWTLVSYIALQDIPGDVHSFPCTAPLPGRFITVQKTRLSLCPNVSLGWRGGLRLAEVVVVEMPAPA